MVHLTMNLEVYFIDKTAITGIRQQPEVTIQWTYYVKDENNTLKYKYEADKWHNETKIENSRKSYDETLLSKHQNKYR